MEIRVMKSVK
ncbi:hypothetical protein Pint_14738 [Pistacia integerrima]|uniref:Uncharacterized protein n=2 Tax=Pistacia TaxID=55512 RepID=A0ACC1AUE7_9ROSI|nr:hypothetical protein Pint_14738 [Pistacia integerrima]KAJ0090320.1 hypothetical protein Patl1_14874 [Pistacia atlantica]